MLDTIVWSNPSTYSEGTGVHHGYSTAPAPDSDSLPVLAPIKAGDPRWPDHAWYAKLDPGGFIVPHVDQGPWVERWHYPISGQGSVWQDWNDNGTAALRHIISVGEIFGAYRMNHHKPHAVYNRFDQPRIVLIVEYDNPVDQPTTDLILCDMIPEVQAMIDNI